MNDRDRYSNLLEQADGAVKLRQFFPHVLDIIPAIVLVFNVQDKKIVWANDRATEFFGFDPSVGSENGMRAIRETIHPTHRNLARQHRKRVGQSPDSESSKAELMARNHAGEWRWFLVEDRVASRDGEGAPLLIVSSALDITERREQEIQRHYMVMELDHRVKNTLSIIQSIAGQTAKTDSAREFARELMSRVRGLIASQDAFQNDNLPSAGMHDLVQAQCSMLPKTLAGRIDVSGPVVRLNPKVFQTIGMALHELLVNAAAHGALSVGGGRVSIDWTLKEDDTDGEFTIEWCEHDGPAPQTPEQRGFGHNLLTRVVSDMTGGEASYELRSEGACWHMRAPAKALLYSVDTETSHPLPEQTAHMQP